MSRDMTLSMSQDVAAFLRDLLAHQSVNAGAADFAQTAAMVVKAMGELDAIIAASPD